MPATVHQLLRHAYLAEIAQHARMDQCGIGRGRERIHRCGFTSLCKLLAKRALDSVQRAREVIGYIIRQILAREDETPGADRIDRRVLVGIAPRWHRQWL